MEIKIKLEDNTSCKGCLLLLSSHYDDCPLYNNVYSVYIHEINKTEVSSFDYDKIKNMRDTDAALWHFKRKRPQQCIKDNGL